TSATSDLPVRGTARAGRFIVSAVLGTARDPECETFSLAWPQIRGAAAALGIDEADLACVDEALQSPAALIVSMTFFAAWGRRPRETDARSDPTAGGGSAGAPEVGRQPLGLAGS